MDEKPTNNLWIRIKERTRTDDIIVGVCYRLPDEEYQADKALCRQTEASCSQALVLMGNFNLIPVRDTTQKGISNPGSSWNALRLTSFPKR